MSESLAEENDRLRRELAAATAAESERDAFAAAMRWLHYDSGTCCTVGCYMPATHHSAAYKRHYCWRCADDGDDVIIDALPHLAALKAALDVPRERA